MSRSEHLDRMPIRELDELVLGSVDADQSKYLLESKTIPQLKADVKGGVVDVLGGKIFDTMLLSFCECFIEKKDFMDWKKMAHFVESTLRNKMAEIVLRRNVDKPRHFCREAVGRDVFPDGANEFSRKAEEQQARKRVEVTQGVYTVSPTTPSSSSSPSCSCNVSQLK